MTRGSGITVVLGVLALFITGCGDTFEEGRAKALESGLKILDLKEGTGEPVLEGDRVEVIYTGWLRESQKKFDSNEGSGRMLPVELGKGEVIPGFEQGLEGMKAGGKRRIFIPAQLGYGSRGAGRDIPPDADLVFQVELVKVVSRAERAPAFEDSKATKTASGLKYIDLKEGTGDPVKNGDKVRVHYTGWLAKNGRQFDSSLKPGGQPLPVDVGTGGVIKGWDEGLLGTKVGGKRRLLIPSNLAYGPRGRGGIPPNADLLFDIEIVSIDPAAQ
jgi:FKBP-type peptidyl-prolyl cis-trans isomerase